jgi:hypothetical protein
VKRFAFIITVALVLLISPEGSALSQDRGVQVAGCSRPSGVQSLDFSRAKYPSIRKHFLRAVGKGWPRILVVNRRGADARRERLLESYPTRRGYDRDEYPPG